MLTPTGGRAQPAAAGRDPKVRPAAGLGGWCGAGFPAPASPRLPGAAGIAAAGDYSAGWAFFMSSWNWAENHWPASGESGSAPDMLFPLRALPV